MEESWPLEYLEAEFLELLPEEDEKGKIDFGAICRGIGEFIGKFACLYGDLNAAARSLLRTTAESLRENLWRMAAMLAGLRGRVTLRYSAYDIIDERPSFPKRTRRNILGLYYELSEIIQGNLLS